MAEREQTRLAKLAIIEFIRDGLLVEDACRRAGYSRASYTKWRQTDPVFRSKVDAARYTHKNDQTRKPDGLVPTDFQGFVKKYFPDRNPHQPQQLMLVDTLKKLKPSEVCLFLIWPQAGKTSTLEDFICRTLALDPDHRFRIVSQSQTLSKNIVGMVKRRMTDTSQWGAYIERFGPFYEKNQERQGRPWHAEEITVLKASGHERDKSLVASSWTSATTGSRIDTLILDDVQTPENYGRAEQIFDSLRATFFTRELDMRVLIIGHKVGPGDLYERMYDEGLITSDMVLPAAGAHGAEPGTPTIPEFWTARPKFHDGGPCCGGSIVSFRTCPNDGSALTAQEAMDLKRHVVGERAWFAMYMQDPVADEMTTFGAYIDACLDHDRTLGALEPV